MVRQVIGFLLSIALLVGLGLGQLQAIDKPSGGGGHGGGKGGKGGAVGAPARGGKSGTAEVARPAGKGAGGVTTGGGSGKGANKPNVLTVEPRRGNIKQGSAEPVARPQHTIK
jgi:hypothetical protein